MKYSLLFVLSITVLGITTRGDDFTFTTHSGSQPLSRLHYLVDAAEGVHHLQDGATLEPKVSGNKFTFSLDVSHSDSKEYAEFFKDEGNAEGFHNVEGKFGSFPEDAHFALRGQFSLMSQNDEISLSLNISQYHSGGNKWLLGQASSTWNPIAHGGTGLISLGKATRAPSLGFPAVVSIERTSHSDFSIAVWPYGKMQTPENWMSFLDDDLRLNQIVLPGSHDAGMAVLYHTTAGSHLSKTQWLSIGSQLAIGMRYFDIRPDLDKGPGDEGNKDTLVTYHRTGDFGANGEDMKSILNSVVTFLSGNESETVILKFSHFRGNESTKASIRKALVNLLNEPEYNAYMYKHSQTDAANPLNLATDVTLKELRGKFIAVIDYPVSDQKPQSHTQPNPNDGIIDTTAGRFRYEDGLVGNTHFEGPLFSNLMVYDSYSNTPDFSIMASDQLDKLRNYADFGNTEYLFLLSWTLTPGLGDSAPVELGKTANDNFKIRAGRPMLAGTYPMANIIYIDAALPEIASEIIAMNFGGQYPVPQRMIQSQFTTAGHFASDWLGQFVTYPDAPGWAYFFNLGPVYPHPSGSSDGPEQLLYWDSMQSAHCWTSEAHYPWYYDFKDSVWKYNLGFDHQDTRYAYNSQSGKIEVLTLSR